jgi:hypothetical protein
MTNFERLGISLVLHETISAYHELSLNLVAELSVYE